VTASQFLDKIRSNFGALRVVFRFPYIHLICVSSEFEGAEEEERESVFSKKLGVSNTDVRRTAKNNLLSVHLLTPNEAAREFPEDDYRDRGYHWLAAYAEEQIGRQPRLNQLRLPAKVIHFYGYKGGQARSTLLALVARELAEDEWRVLAVDADFEAPSLDVIFSRTARTISSTLLGLTLESSEVQPERIAASEGSGYIDLLSCRPQSREYDIDAAAFSLRAVLDPSDIDKLARKIGKVSVEREYDAILIDHRSGLSHTTLPWMAALAGPAVVCLRHDDQWRPAHHSKKAILNMNKPDPGLFVSWKPDEEHFETYRKRNYTQISSLLDVLADVVASGGDGTIGDSSQLELSFAELEDHWVMWPYDSAFRQFRIPDRKSLSGQTLEALASIRDLLDISGRKGVRPSAKLPSLSPSGSIDPGDLIQTDAIRQLKAAGNSISFIFGRKGTGKTRLLRELAETGLGEPLVVDPNFGGSAGIKSASPELTKAGSTFASNPTHLWWQLLSAALDHATTSSPELVSSFSKAIVRKDGGGDPVTEVLAKCGRWPKRVFLLDGLETAFTSEKIFQFVESLFHFLQVIEADSRLNSKIQIKLFLRTDLAQRGYQNSEQQFHGRTIYLNWDTQKIFNFVLSRVASISWFRSNFVELVSKIRADYDHILNGSLAVSECESLLMHAFPSKLSRNNLFTKTFLKTYFADTASPEASTGDKLRYYPRIFDKFLEVLANPKATDKGTFAGSQLDRDGKINQGLIFFAHEAAAADYLEQLRSELNYLISFSIDVNENADKVRTLLAAFDGLKTPFTVDEHIQTLAVRTNIDPNDIRKAMQSMRNMGLFEERPGYPEEWRVGRLFKSALRMKYVRA
jgi:Mrp family chromosome partitioning ATPase